MYFPDLIEEYKQLLQEMKAEGVTSGDMYREVKQAIEWMETGYDPAEYRAATRTDAYTFDPYLMQNFIRYVGGECALPDALNDVQDQLHEWDVEREAERLEKVKSKVNEAMVGLTDDERAVFIAIKGECMPFSRVAKMLGISKSTVQSYYSRAQKKIKENVLYGSQMNLFAS